MAEMKLTDLIQHLTEENKRLAAELKSNEKCIKLLQSYRKCLLTLSANCECNPMVNNNVMITILESEYKSIFPSDESTGEDDQSEQTIEDREPIDESQLEIDVNDNEIDVNDNEIDNTIDIPEIETEDEPIGHTFESVGEEVLPHMSTQFVPLITQPSVVTNNNTYLDQSPNQKIYRIIIQKNDQKKDQINEQNTSEEVEGKKLFKCQMKGCPRTFNSLRKLQAHHSCHNNDNRRQPKPKPNPIVKHKRNHNENERQRRQRSAQLFTTLLEEMPHLEDRPKRPPNREILCEAVDYIKKLETKQKEMINQQNKETKRQELLQKSLKGALKQLTVLTPHP